ncbi:hypothetical protein LINGRAHAP2_LOCUS28777 [Linum grandiflorum]
MATNILMKIINSILVISFIMVVMMSTAESTSRHLLTPACTVSCTEFVGVKRDETCDSISQDNNSMTVSKFLSLNPNLVCENMFEGEWVCVDGTGC